MVSSLATVAFIAMASFFLTVSGQAQQAVCKDPVVEKRTMADDVRYAAPFYVVALPRTPKAEQIDNVCYTYYEAKNGSFFHIESVTYKNGSNEYHKFSKADIMDRIGLAEGSADDSESSECVYHDYTLKPVCNFSVFILYRCFIRGECSKIDQGRVDGVDVRVTLAASPQLTEACKNETAASLRDTSSLDGGDYIILPQKLTPRCITRYNGLASVNEGKALGPTVIEGNANELGNRLGGSDTQQPPAVCKEPYVEKRAMAGDVRYAAPFYVVAMPRTPKTEQIDNVCYTYYEAKNGSFFHIISVVYNNGSNEYHKFSKADIMDRIGLAEGTADDSESSECVYHDYTLKPVCNFSVFILYRCFIKGECRKIDQGRLDGVDVRVTLAASPQLTEACKNETAASLRDTSSLDGGEYIILPQKLSPRCITRYNGMISVNENRALGATVVNAPAPALTPPASIQLDNRLGAEADPVSDPVQEELDSVFGTGTGTATGTGTGTMPAKLSYADVVKGKGKKKKKPCIPRRPVITRR